MSIERVEGTLGNLPFIIETGRMAKQAHGAVTVRCGDTIVLSAVVSERKPKETADFFPLTVDYRERTYAAGKIPGGFFKREGRPTEVEILTSRLIDRPIRPLFPEDYLNDTVLTLTVLSAGGENVTDISAMNAAFTSLFISDVPFENAVGAVRVGLIEGQFVINPTAEQLEKSDLDLVVAGTEHKITMIEAGSNEISEEQMMDAIHFGHAAIKKIVDLQKELQRKAGKKKREVTPLPIPADWMEKARSIVGNRFIAIFETKSKEEREEATRKLYDDVKAGFDTTAADFKEHLLKLVFDRVEKEKVREYILDHHKRPDGRAVREIRQITCEVGLLPRTHGSSLFTRGQTQSLSVATLGTRDDEQMIDALEGEVWKRFMLHYNFPSFSVGESKPNRGPGRREIGHGALAERALLPIMPTSEAFPYTVRLVSDIMESNGSSSMATVCGGTLALLDAGVPIKAPVAGIALGLVTRGEKFQVVTDLQGIEDHHGDMDFKAAGTRKGLTALQMDIKINGVSDAILAESFDQAKEARMKILDKIEATLAEPRKELSVYAPRITTLKIPIDKIGELIGPGGKNIKKIVEETGAKINIEDDGTVSIASTEAAASEAAIQRVQAICEVPEVGRIYQGTVKRLVPFGAFIEILPGREALCHVSEVSEGFVKNVNDYLRLGDVVPVQVLSIEDNGKASLSIKAAKEGGMPMLPEGAERDPISEIKSRDGRGGRSRR